MPWSSTRPSSFHQTIKTCDPDSITDDTEITVALRYKDGLTFKSADLSTTDTFGELTAQDPALLYKGGAVYHFAKGLSDLKDSDDPATVKGTMTDWLVRAEMSNPHDADLAEIRRLIEML